METVADELDRMDGTALAKRAADPIIPPTLPGTPKLPAPGIYFGMPEDFYHALPALSSGGVKWLLASPMQFWANTAWLSEAGRTREKREKENPKTQLTRTIGKAYHCRLLEGASEYALRFATELAAEDCEGALESTAEIKAAIENAGHKPVTKVPDNLPDGAPFMRPAKKDDWIEQLLSIDPKACILDVIQRKHFADNDGKHFIPADAADQIEIAARMIEADPNVRRAFMGGYAEVTLIWHCAETGVPMKARVDYLQLKAAVDLKSIACDGQSLDIALRKAIARYKYQIQPSVYLEGIKAVRALIREGAAPTICTKEFSAEPGKWARQWAAETTEPKWLWIFQQKGSAPVTRGVFYPTGGMKRMLTDDMLRTAKRRFVECCETFGLDPWVDAAPISDLSDEDIPEYSLDI